SLAFAINASASELDNEAAVTNQGIQGTLVIRVDQRDNSVSYLQVEEGLSSEQQALSVAHDGQFQTLPENQVKNELDNAAGASSWYYYYVNPYNHYYNNCVNWYGYNYRPYYSYNHGYYNYYYYGWYNRWW